MNKKVHILRKNMNKSRHFNQISQRNLHVVQCWPCWSSWLASVLSGCQLLLCASRLTVRSAFTGLTIIIPLFRSPCFLCGDRKLDALVVRPSMSFVHGASNYACIIHDPFELCMILIFKINLFMNIAFVSIVHIVLLFVFKLPSANMNALTKHWSLLSIP